MPNVYSWSSNDAVDLEGVDSVSLGIVLELWSELLQESNVAILVQVVPNVSSVYSYFTGGHCWAILGIPYYFNTIRSKVK